MDVYIFIGPPGSGKGTLSSQCVKELHWERLSTGELCRKHIAEQTSVGKEIDLAIKSGKLVSDDLITSMVEQWFVEHSLAGTTVILDGYPRTVAQAKALDRLFQNSFPNVRVHVVRFAVSEDAVRKRLGTRLICLNSNCQAVYSQSSLDLKPRSDMTCDACGSALGIRKDDQAESVVERLRMYPEHERELLNYYRFHKQEIPEILAEKSPAEVFSDFKKYISTRAI